MASLRRHDRRAKRRRFLRDERRATAVTGTHAAKLCEPVARVGNLLAKALRGELVGANEPATWRRPLADQNPARVTINS